jgi:hypothetical protein
MERDAGEAADPPTGSPRRQASISTPISSIAPSASAARGRERSKQLSDSNHHAGLGGTFDGLGKLIALCAKRLDDGGHLDDGGAVADGRPCGPRSAPSRVPSCSTKAVAGGPSGDSFRRQVSHAPLFEELASPLAGTAEEHRRNLWEVRHSDAVRHSTSVRRSVTSALTSVTPCSARHAETRSATSRVLTRTLMLLGGSSSVCVA